MWKNKRVQLVFPAYNEEENIKQAIEQFYATSLIDEIIVVDNNSHDATKTEIQKTKARYVFEATPGYGSALRRGLAETDADIVITCEPDGTFGANDVLKLLVYSDDFDVVFGTRTSKYCIWNGAHMPRSLRYGNVVVAKLLEYLFNGPCLTDVGCTMKLITREVLTKILPQFRVTQSHFQPEFMIDSILASKKIVEIPLNYYQRKGTSKITGDLRKAFMLGCTMIFYIIYRRLRYAMVKK